MQIINYISSLATEFLKSISHPLPASSRLFSDSDMDQWHFKSALPNMIKDSSVLDALVNHLKTLDCIKECAITTSAASKFISVKMDMLWLLKNLPPQPLQQEPKEFIVDYCGVNLAKQMHAGHIRSIIIGDTLSRALEYNGHKVHRVNHSGDWGMQFAQMICFIMLKSIEVKDLKIQELNSIYASAKEYFASNPQLSHLYKKTMSQMNSGEKSVMQVYDYLCTISNNSLYETLTDFKSSLTAKDQKGESYYKDSLDQIINSLVDSGVLKREQDSSVIYQKDSTTVVIKSSDSNYLYAAYDIAALYYRIKNYPKLSEIIYCVDSRQELHFKAVFDIARRSNWIGPDQKLIHLKFGSVLSADRKPLKTRSGQAASLTDLLQMGHEEYQKQKESFKSQTSQEFDKSLVIDSLKFFELSHSASKDYVFDASLAMSTQGDTGASIALLLMRLDSILYNCHIDPISTPAGTITSSINSLPEEFDEVIKQMLLLKQSLSLNSSAEWQSTKYYTQLNKICSAINHCLEKINISSADKDTQYFVAYCFNTISDFLKIAGFESYQSFARKTSKLKP